MPKGVYDRSLARPRGWRNVPGGLAELAASSQACAAPPKPQNVAVVRKSTAQKPAGKTVTLAVTLPESGMILLLRDSAGHVAGTMFFSDSGVRFRKANGKKKDGRELSYGTLQRLDEVGLT